MLNKTDTMKKIVDQFREKIRKTDFDGLQKVMNRFPTGCCKVSSMFFAKFLVDNNIANEKDIKFIANAYNGQSYHAWIELNDKIIDISIDQFHEANQFIFGLDSSFHLSFDGANKYSYHEIMTLEKSYETDFNNNYAKLNLA